MRILDFFKLEHVGVFQQILHPCVETENDIINNCNWMQAQRFFVLFYGQLSESRLCTRIHHSRNVLCFMADHSETNFC